MTDTCGKTNGVIFNVVRASLHDGPGVRTVVYLKGCNLRCTWCHNPEGIGLGCEIMHYPDKCIGCGRCADICPKCHTGGEYLRDGCVSCGKCAEVCPSGALRLCGMEITAAELYRQIAKDRSYFAATGGGVTLSGGECLMQWEFAAAVLELCRKNGIHTAIETALCVKKQALDAVIDRVDVFICDLKHVDGKIHEQYTGRGNGLILENIKYLAQNHKNIIIRIPLIPGVNDSDENLCAAAEFINDCGGGIAEAELLKYNDLAGAKYKNLDKSFNFDGVLTQPEDEFQRKRELFSERLKLV